MSRFRAIQQSIQRWQVPLVAKIKVITETGKITPTTIITEIDFKGSVQPYTPEEAEIEGVENNNAIWSFQWLQIHTSNLALGLKTRDSIVYNNKNYIIKSILNYSEWGYIQYNVFLAND